MYFCFCFYSGKRRRSDRGDRGGDSSRENVGELERARRRREDDEDEYDRPARSKLCYYRTD